MNDTMSGMGWFPILFVIIVIWAIFGGGFGFGNQNRGWNGECGCGRVSNCEVERQGIIDSARTQYMVESTAHNTQEYLGTKIDFYEFQNLRDQLAQERNKNMVLENRIYSDGMFNGLSKQIGDCCCEFNRRLDGIEGRMLTKPALSGVAATCGGQIVPANAYGYNGYGFGYGGTVIA